ncbi:MAG: phosphotransacetylase family protein [Candidatus Lokiarchaeota archaeon]|nr:phosphotransacetylase family protein [Candidatus Lokiarchaeota archaeon]
MTKLRSLYLSSVHSGSGKTEIALGLGLLLKDKGYKVAYFKPFSRRKGNALIDTELAITSKTFGMDPAKMSPVFIEPVYFETLHKHKDEYRGKVIAAYKAIKEEYDVVLIEGGNKFNSFMSFDLDDATLANQMDNSPILTVNLLESDTDVCDLLLQREFLKLRKGNYSGCVLNRVSKIMVSRAKQEFIPYLKAAGIPCFGIIEKDPRLTAPTFREIMEMVGGKLLDEDESQYDLDVLVKNAFVGAMSAHSALSYLRTSGQHAVVITGGDRADIVLTALETNVAGIILTGNLYPDQHVISATQEKHVPLVLVPHDTYATATKVEQTVAGLQINEAGICKDLVSSAIDVDAIIKVLKA